MWTALAKLWRSAPPSATHGPVPLKRAIDLAAHYDPAPGAVAEAVGADLVLLDLEHGGAFRLNATGRFVYEELRQGRTPSASASALAMRHKVDAARVECDVTDVIGQLLDAGLLAERTSRAPAS